MTSVRHLAITRRAATSADIPFLRSLYADAHLELAVLPTDTRFVLIDMQFRAQRRQHAQAHPHASHEVLLADGKGVGRLVVDRSCEPIRIVDITVALSHRREGIAGDALAAVVREADEAGRRIELTVWARNTAATTLVTHAGFVEVADEGGYVTFERTPAA